MSASPDRPFGVVALTLRFAGGVLMLTLATAITAVIALPLLPWRVLRIKLHNAYGKLIGLGVVRLAAARPVVRGAERLDGSMPAIYVANHSSNLDFFVSIWLCPYGGCGVVKKEFVYLPFFGWLYLLSGHLRISRTDRSKTLAALADTAALVKKHRLGVWIMPEGSRSRDARLQPFKKGFVHMAIATGLPVVPVVIHEGHRLWPPRRWRPDRGGTLAIDVLPPIDTASWRQDTSDDHAREVHDRMAACLGPAQRPAA